MAERNIRQQDDPVLRNLTVPVSRFSPHLVQLIEDMVETMYEADGIGLAAPQVGISKRVIVFRHGDEVHELVNPEITFQEGEEVEIEGCLSLPGVYGEVPRAASVKVKGQNRHGEAVELAGEGLLARVLQHEIDHLEGTLFVDRAQRLLTAEEIKSLLENA